MIFQNKSVVTMMNILNILQKGKSKYSIMFKGTKASHTTLQLTLNYLIKKKFIKKYNKGHMDVDYEITLKGKELLEKLEELKEML